MIEGVADPPASETRPRRAHGRQRPALACFGAAALLPVVVTLSGVCGDDPSPAAWGDGGLRAVPVASGDARAEPDRDTGRGRGRQTFVVNGVTFEAGVIESTREGRPATVHGQHREGRRADGP